MNKHALFIATTILIGLTISSLYIPVQEIGQIGLGQKSALLDGDENENQFGLLSFFTVMKKDNHEDQIQNECAGSPKERRKLTALGNQTTDQQWMQMKKCMNRREDSLSGIYSLHVSKSGGTSLCNLFKSKQCFISTRGQKKANCWRNKYKSSSIDLSPQWVRKRTNGKKIFPPPYMEYNETDTPSSSCQDIKYYLRKWNQSVAMSENWLPKGGELCEHDFSNIIIFREPMSRILSHYQHLYDVCFKISSSNDDVRKECKKMLWEQHGEKYFNVTYMLETYDIISDNYYVRSLNDQVIYKEVSPLNQHQHKQIYFHKALENLQSFDWIMILQRDDDEEIENIQLIIEEGLSFHDIQYPHSNNRKRFAPNVARIKIESSDYRELRKRNHLDLELWKEAKFLNDLDVSSLKRLSTLPIEGQKERIGRCYSSL